MVRNIEIMALIPTRGGSRRLPGKNKLLIDGIPLLGRCIQSAKTSQYINRIIVTSEDDELQAIARQYGADVISRPAKLATDETPMLPVAQHALGYLSKYEGYMPLVIVLLQADCPLTSTEDIDAAIKLLLDTGADTVLSVSGKKDETQTGYLSRIDEPENGAIYLNRRHVIIEWNSLVGNIIEYYHMPPERSLEIHTLEDYERVKRMIEGKDDNIRRVFNQLDRPGDGKGTDTQRKAKRSYHRKIPAI